VAHAGADRRGALGHRGRTARLRAGRGVAARVAHVAVATRRLVGLAEADSCRREFLLAYFGEAYRPPCGNCDVCDARGPAEATRTGGPATVPEGAPPVGARVRHASWGEGTVARIDAEDDQLTVVFDDVGYKTLGIGLVAERRLLEEIDV